MSSRPRNFGEAVEELGKFANNAGGDMKDKLQAELKDLEAKIEKLKPKLEDLARTAGDEANKAKNKVEEKVQQNPWAAIGIVGLVAFVIGIIFASSRSRRD